MSKSLFGKISIEEGEDDEDDDDEYNYEDDEIETIDDTSNAESDVISNQ